MKRNNQADTSAPKRQDRKPARLRPPPPLRRTTQFSTPEHNLMVEKVCGLVDPFCQHATGAKYPDDSSSRTLAFTIHQSQIFSTDSNGSVGGLFCPQVLRNPITSGTITGTNLAPAQFGAPIVPELSGASKFRIVSCGFRLRNIAPALTSSGTVYLRTYSQENSTQFASFDGTSYTGSQNLDIPLNDCHDVALVSQHTSQPPATFYTNEQVQPDAPTTFYADQWVAPGFSPSSFMLVGGPASTPALQVEVILHVEYQFEVGSALQLAATPAPTANPLLTQLSNSVTSLGGVAISTATESLSEFVRHKASSLLTSILGSTPRGRLAKAAYNTVLSVD